MPLSTQNTLLGEDEGIPVFSIDKDTPSGSPFAITTWTRLAVGAMMYGIDIFKERTRTWQKPEKKSPSRERSSSLIIEGESKDVGHGAHSHVHQRDEQAVRTLIGVLFDTQKHLTKNVNTFRKIERMADRMSYPIMRGLRRQSIFKPAYRLFDRMVGRGESELQRWGEIGKIEEERSRELLKNATLSTFDSSIDYLSTNPDIQELVQYQSTNLLNDLIEEVRERAVTVNTVMEGWVRKILHLAPRCEIPGPSPEVRRGANLFPSTNKRI